MTDREQLERVRALFEQARERTEPLRSAWLDAHCGADVALRQEVESLLRADEATDGVLDRLASRLRPVADLLEPPAPVEVGPYRIVGEAGRGGMGVVYRAHDPRLRRDVALKFLPHSLGGEAAARERFIGEARAASALDHPGICTVHDVGVAGDGRVYIAMAWYGGGTLEERLRAGPLPPAEAVRIACDVADALACAHRAGIVHRDVKPANVAFGEAGATKVLDFGVAALETDRSARVAGTPRYMAPEQLRGGVADRRVDVWSVGVLLHEMLTGRVPFPAADPAARRDAIERARTTPLELPGVPPSLRPVLRRALAVDPDARYAGAAELAQALRRTLASSERGVRSRYVAAGAALVALLALMALLVARARPGAGGTAVADPRAVAVLPFRVSGEPTLAWLQDGMVDLLAAAFTGEGGLRAADPRTVYHALSQMSAAGHELAEDSARELARRIGVGNVLLGDVVGTAGNLVINARMLDLRGRVIGRARAEGSPARLTTLVDSVAAQLLSLSAREAPQRIGTLVTASLPALRAYLDGQADYRRGAYEDALRHYARALQLDSTFALAGLGLEVAGGWVGGVEATRARGRDVAWRYRDRLADTDRALLAAAVGPNYPHPSTTHEVLAAIEDGLRLAPDRVELWYMQADAYLHHGRVMGVADWEDRAEAGFRRALALDSTFAPPMHHLVLLHARRGRLVQMDAAAAAQLAREQSGATAHFIEWLRAAARGERSQNLPPLDSLAVETLGWIAMIAQDDALDTELGRRAMRERATRAGTTAERFERVLGLHAVALNSGRPGEALALIEDLRDGEPDSDYRLRLRVLDALWADGDSAAAHAAADTLAHALARRAAVTDEPATYRMNRCVLEQWRIRQGQAGAAGSAAAQRRATPVAVKLCEAAAAALQEAATPGTTGTAIAHFDSLLASGPFDLPLGDGSVEYANVALALAWERAGDRRRALDAIRRRVYFLGWQAGLAASLREEARLALLIGDTVRARHATRHYLALRPEPAAVFRAEHERMRAQYQRLRR